MSLIFIIRREVPSQNMTQYSHWRAYHAEKQQWWILMRAAMPLVLPVKAMAKVQLHCFRGKLLDHANLVGGAKPIPDHLRSLGYIWDDKPTWFQCDYLQFQVPKDQVRTEIHLLNFFDESTNPSRRSP